MSVGTRLLITPAPGRADSRLRAAASRGQTPVCLSLARKDAGQAALDPTLMNSLYFTGLLSHFSHARLFVTPWTAARQAPLSVGLLQAIILEWFALPSHRGIVLTLQDRTCISYVSYTGKRVLYRERHLGSPHFNLIMSLRLHLQMQAHSETLLGYMNLAGRGTLQHMTRAHRETLASFCCCERSRQCLTSCHSPRSGLESWAL